MCNERTELLRGEKEWPDALRRRAGRIVPAHKFKLSQYQLVYRRGSVSKQVPKRPRYHLNLRVAAQAARASACIDASG